MNRLLVSSLLCLCLCIVSPLSALGAEPDEGAALKQATAFMSALAQGHADEADAMLTQPVKDGLKGMGVSGLAEFWGLLQSPAQLGPLSQVGELWVKRVLADAVVVIAPCSFAVMPMDLAITIAPDGLVSGFFIQMHEQRNPNWAEYVRPDAFEEVPVALGSPAAPVGGMLTLPKGTQSYPIVVMLSGSGPNDMDETVAGNKPFRDIAGGLATAGIAGLRFDKRTRTYPEGTPTTGILRYEYLDDAAAALALAARLPGVSRVVLLGHSEGAILAPTIAKGSGSVAGLICLAGPVTPLEDVVAYQYDYLASIGRVDAATASAVRGAVVNLKAGALPDAAHVAGIPAGYYRELRALGSPAEVAASLKLPMFIAFGASDYQVPPTEEALWRKALADAPGIDYKVYQGLYHLFMKGQGAPSPADYNVVGHVDARVIEDLVNWIRRL